MRDGEEIRSAEKENREAAMELALQAGKLLLENGAEIFRVQETMERICRHYGVESANEFVMSNGIIATAGSGREQMFAQVQNIPVGGARLDKVAAVNQLSREIEAGRYTAEEAFAALGRIRDMPGKPGWVQVAASGVASAAFCFVGGGSPGDAFAAFLAGLALYLYLLYVGRPFLSKIVGNIGGGALVTVLCGLLCSAGIGAHLDSMVIGSVIPLVPGVAFVNWIRDIAYEDYISGWIRLLDAMVVFFSIAVGVGAGASLVRLLTGGVL